MPYVPQYERNNIDKELDGLIGLIEKDGVLSGELNYIITTILHAFITNSPNYSFFNTAIGALECAKLELYRRKIAPYEDKKIKENGDI